ncbi:hypothetical protein AF72_02335 [Xylella taiwanensis]|uniref:Uncharacterized protein n=1 Tax=Xylella taiwanensis TaxID=1444770 RepID=Z9JL22_9GAMM|nr:hypothetical protein AF72_02335 [Xylella taiwanensis]
MPLLLINYSSMRLERDATLLFLLQFLLQFVYVACQHNCGAQV